MFRLATGFALGAALVTAQQPDERDEAWIHAPEHVAEEIKNRRLGRRHRASLLTERGTVGAGTAKIQHDLGRAESALAVALRGHPDILKKEDDLLHKASMMAGYARASEIRAEHMKHIKGQASAVPKQAPKLALTHVDAKVDNAPLVGVQKAEAALIGQGFGILHEAKDIKGEVVDAIGESDPRTAAKVEHLMDELQKSQSNIMHGEQQLANGIGQILHETPKETPPHAKHAALTQHVARLSASAEMASLAGEERKLSRDEIQTLSGVEQLRGEVEQALAKNPAAAGKAASLLKTVEKEQQSIVHIDEAAAARDHELAAHVTPTHHKKAALVKTVVSEASEKVSLERNEEKLSQDDILALTEAERVKRTAADALMSDPSAAAKVANLMSTLEKEQQNIVRIDQSALAQDHGHQGLATLAQQHSEVESGENAAMLSKLELRKHQLQTAVSKRESLAKDTRRILAETDRAQAAVEEELGGTDTGSQVAEILQRAEAAERSVAKGAKQQVTLAKKEVQTVEKFAHSLVQKRSFGTSHTDATLLSKLAHNEHALRSLAAKREGLVKNSRHLLAETDRAQAAIEEELGGTDVGTQVAGILQKAQAAERLAANDSTKQAALAKKDVQSIATLEKDLGSAQ